jgi:glycerol 3-phosphatase-1
MEGLLPKLYGADAVEIPGARSLLQDLIARSAPWTIVTSGTVPLVTGVSAPPRPPNPLFLHHETGLVAIEHNGMGY